MKCCKFKHFSIVYKHFNNSWNALGQSRTFAVQLLIFYTERRGINLVAVFFSSYKVPARPMYLRLNFCLSLVTFGFFDLNFQSRIKIDNNQATSRGKRSLYNSDKRASVNLRQRQLKRLSIRTIPIVHYTSITRL